MNAVRNSDGTISIPMRAENDSGRIGDGMVTIGQGDPAFKTWDAWLRSHPPEPIAGMADEPPAGALKSDPKGKPASGEVALAGDDGKVLASAIRNSKQLGVQTVAHVVEDAVKNYDGGELLDSKAVRAIADAIAAANATAELLGRVRVRDLAGMAPEREEGDEDGSLARFADSTPSEIATPQAALDYFTSLVPKLGVNPERFAEEQRRRAFTLANVFAQNVVASVQSKIAEALTKHKSTADARADIQAALDAAGVTTRNPQYAEMVFRTNAMDAYQTGAYEEAQSEDIADLFPVWQYLGIKDGRQGSDHEPHFDKYYPRARAFADVRGDRPFNCRCSLRWVDKFEWQKLQSKGAKAEE